MNLSMKYEETENQSEPEKKGFARRRTLPEDFVLHRNMRTESRISEMAKKKPVELVTNAEDDFDIDIPENDDFDLKIDFDNSQDADTDWDDREVINGA